MRGTSRRIRMSSDKAAIVPAPMLYRTLPAPSTESVLLVGRWRQPTFEPMSSTE
jgi:hypothetical protein